MRIGAAVAASTCVMLLAGCAGSEERPSGQASTRAPEAAASAAAPLAPANWSLANSLDTGSSFVGSLVVDSGIAVFGFGGPGASSATSLGVWNTEESEFVKLADSSYENGVIDGVAFDGQDILFVDIEAVGDTGTGERLQWKIRHTDLSGDLDEVISESSPEGDVTPPYVHSGGGRFVWSTWQDDDDPWAGRHVYEWTPGDREPATVVEKIWLNDSATPVADGIVFSRTENDDRWPSGMSKSDVYFLPDGTVTPIRVSDSGLALSYEVVGSAVVWTETNPRAKRKLSRTDPRATLVASLDGSDDPQVIQRGFSSGNPTGGDGWFAWWDQNLNLKVLHTSTGVLEKIRTAKVHVPTRPAGADNLLVVADHRVDEGQGRVTLRAYDIHS